jgi:hypothetical protein
VDLPVTGRVAIGDLNGDGKPDLASHKPSSTGPTGTVSVFLNISTVGTFAFADKVDFPTQGNFSDAYIADFDVDGKPDLAFLDYVYWSVSVLRNTSTGGSLSFAEGGRYPAASSPTSLAIADLDRDGKPDMVTAGGFNPNYYFTVLRNTSTPGTISFAGAYSYDARGIYDSAPIIGDLNGDGKPELVVESVTGDNCSRDSTLITILQNTSTAGSISFRHEKTLSFAGCSAYLGPIVDLNGDGKSDLLISGVVYRNETVCSPCTPPTFLNDGTIVANANCGNNDGALYIVPTSGTAPYLYSKDGGTTYVAGPNAGSGFQNLAAGTYRLRLKDANGCESAIVEREVKLNCTTTCTPPTFLNDGTIVANTACGKNEGAIYIVPTSGAAPFMYSINGGTTYVSGPNNLYGFANLSAGTYKLRLKDANGCESAIVERTVSSINCPTTCTTPPTLLNNGMIIGHATCGANDGALYLIPTSGTAPFQYSINGGTTYVSGPDGGTSFTGLAPGTYQLRIKDANGCESAVVQKEVLALYGSCAMAGLSTKSSALPQAAESSTAILAYPNPTKGVFRLQLRGTTGKVQVKVLNSNGAVVQQKRMNVNEGSTIDFNLSGKAKGLYFIQVVSEHGVQVAKVLVQ